MAEGLLPIKQIGAIDVAMAEEASEEERKKRLEAAKSAGVGVRPIDTSGVDEAAASFGASSVDYIYEQPPNQLFQGILPKYIGIQIFHPLLQSMAPQPPPPITPMPPPPTTPTNITDPL